MKKKIEDKIAVIDENFERVDFLDSRYYKNGEKHYPSITFILQSFPKGKFFEDWLKDVGYNAEIIAKRSAEEGTATHNIIEDYLKGKEIKWIGENKKPICSLNVWKMVLRFVEFWEREKPELIASEIFLKSHVHEIAGTSDLVIKLRDELWLLDIKTSNHLNSSYDLQLAAYQECWNEEFPENKINRRGILWLKSSKAGPDKNRIQGKGWEIYEPKSTQEEDFEIFKCVYKIFKIIDKSKPVFESYPNKIKIKNDE